MAAETINGNGHCILLTQEEAKQFLEYQLARSLFEYEIELIEEGNVHIDIDPETEASIRSTLAMVGIAVIKIGVPEGDPLNN